MIETLFALGLLSVGLFAGLMMTLVVIMQRQWESLGKNEYVPYFKGFLLTAKGNPVISLLTFTSFLLPWGMGTLQLLNGAALQGWISISAGVIFFGGCLLVTLWLNFPIYNKVIGWEHAEAATDWQEVRGRFYRLNVIRMSSALLTFVCLAAGALL